jgi:hypothetical protein
VVFLHIKSNQQIAQEDILMDRFEQLKNEVKSEMDIRQ